MVRVYLFVVVLLLHLFETKNEELRVAWLAPKEMHHHLTAASSMGGIALSIDDIEDDDTLLGTDTFSVSWKNSSCSSKVSLSAMYQVLIEEDYTPHVIIGPPCSGAMQYVGMLAGYRDIPIISWLSKSAVFGQKETYTSLIRTLPPINAIGRGLMETLINFDWRLVELIASSDDQYQQLGEGIRLQVASNNVTITRYVDNAGNENPDADEIRSMFQILKNEARIVILCVPLVALRTWMIEAERVGMAGGDYAFIFITGDLPTQEFVDLVTGTSLWQQGDGDDERARAAFESLLIFSTQSQDANYTTQFAPKAEQAANNPKWVNMIGLDPDTSDRYAGYLHDAIRLYASLVTEIKAKGDDHSSGSVLLDQARNREFSGPEWVTGNVYLDENADRMPVFYLWDMDSNGRFRLAQRTNPSISDKTGKLVMDIEIVEDIIWGNGKTGDDNKPVAIPECGFRGEKCKDITLYIAIPVAVVLLILVAVIGILVWRKYQFEKSLNQMIWKLNHSDLKKMDRDTHGSMFLRVSRASISHSGTIGMHYGEHLRSHSNLKADSSSEYSGGHMDQVFIDRAKYKGRTVAIKTVRKQKVKQDRKLLLDMRNMTNVKHINMATFIGATIEHPLTEVWDYYTKGGLQDVLWNDNMKLDDMFKYSIANDMLKGLIYIHNSPLKVHGRLKSTNVVVDGRWTCKLTDYGLEALRESQEDDPEISDHQRFSSLFWTAPELMSTVNKDNLPIVTTKTVDGDIYAAAIILKEIFARNEPYSEYDDYSPMEIVTKVRKSNEDDHVFRPSLDEVKLVQNSAEVKGVIEKSWVQNPASRPSAQSIQTELQKINPNKSSNVADNMAKMMERYSNNLEELVAERTVQVEAEKKKSEVLLYRMLPKSIADDLKAGNPLQAEDYDAVTIYFSDIVKFTNLSAESTPMQVVNLLNKLYTIWDAIIAEHDVYKVETIGDAYMVVSGVPQRNGDNHAAEIANTAMDLLSGITNFEVPHKPDYKLRIRIGLHTGSVVAGVVGHAMPRYCLFGSTVNTAAMFEAGGAPMRIHISETTFKLLSKFSGYQIADRGSALDCKGGVQLHSYWLMGRDGYNKPLPDFDEVSADDDPKPQKLPTTLGRKFRSSVSRPSQESGFFDVEANDPMTSRKSSMNDEGQKRLEGIIEGSLDDNSAIDSARTDSSRTDFSRKDSQRELLPSIKEKDNLVFEPVTEIKYPPPDVFIGVNREKTLHLDDFEEGDDDVTTSSDSETDSEQESQSVSDQDIALPTDTPDESEEELPVVEKQRPSTSQRAELFRRTAMVSVDDISPPEVDDTLSEATLSDTSA